MEYRKSEGKLVTFENVTAASNIVAGAMVAFSGTQVYTMSSGTTGYGETGTFYNFIGVLDEAVTAGQSPITVWTEGVFQFDLASASVSGNLNPGMPVWATDSGTHGREVGTVGVNGTHSVGTLVGMGTWGSTASTPVQVKINTQIWTIAATSALSATAPLPGAFPALATR